MIFGPTVIYEVEEVREGGGGGVAEQRSNEAPANPPSITIQAGGPSSSSSTPEAAVCLTAIIVVFLCCRGCVFIPAILLLYSDFKCIPSQSHATEQHSSRGGSGRGYKYTLCVHSKDDVDMDDDDEKKKQAVHVVDAF